MSLILRVCKFRFYRSGKIFCNFELCRLERNARLCPRARFVLAAKLVIGYLWWKISLFGQGNQITKVSVEWKNYRSHNVNFATCLTAYCLNSSLKLVDNPTFCVEHNPHMWGKKFSLQNKLKKSFQYGFLLFLSWYLLKLKRYGQNVFVKFFYQLRNQLPS